MKAKEITDKLGNNRNHNTVRNLLVKLREEGKIVLTKDIYTVAPNHSQHSQSSKDSQRSQRSQATYTTSQNGSKPDYGPDYGSSQSDYGEGATIVRANTHANGHGKPNDNIPNDTPDYADYGNYDNARSRLPEQLTPDNVVNYPGDVRLWHGVRGLKIKRARCTRSHENVQYLPWYSRSGEWEDSCTQCYPALAKTIGRECFE